MRRQTRRDFLRAGAAAATAVGAGLGFPSPVRSSEDVKAAPAAGVEVLHPQGRVPLSFIIDDSTCLVNMGAFCMPQFAEAWPERGEYKKPWKTWPREIPDAFLREFGEWCAEHGVKGKFSVVPNPACVGWLDRELPGWSRRELLDSLKLVRELMAPGWDIHPEMITHTRVIHLGTGRPMEEISAATMENSYPQVKKSADELAAYLAYALRILKNCDLPCEGITTPGGFGNGVESELALAVRESVMDVYGAEIPHYFKYVSEGDESTRPKLEHVAGAGTGSPRLVVNIPAGTGDWFGNWDGDSKPEGFRYASLDASSGRMVELIEKGEPALMLCHWPGLYSHGSRAGFEDFKRVVLALEGRFRDRTIWLKLAEIARYWAARELTRIEREDGRISLSAPFASPRFTVRIQAADVAPPSLLHEGSPVALTEVSRARDLKPGTWLREGDAVTVCFDLEKGATTLTV